LLGQTFVSAPLNRTQGFTLEPGIYTDTYALRICANLFIDGKRQVSLSAPIQRKIIAVLAPASGADSLSVSST